MEFDFVRILLAFFSGYFLTVSGSLAQLSTNNKLASSSTLGFDGVGVLCILAAQSLISFFSVNLSIENLSLLIFGSIFVFIIIVIKFKKSSSDISKNMNKIILIGLGFNLFIGGVFSIIQFLFIALNYEFPTGIWFGNFKQFEIETLYLFGVLFLVSFVLVWRMSKKLSFLALGPDFAKGLNIDVSKVLRGSLLVSFFLTGLVVSYFGVFSFIGLIFPHILRSIGFFKYSMKNELIIGSVFAGVFLSTIDFLCYHFTFFGAEVPVGMVCSVVGSFTLLALLIQRQSIK